jgi:alanine racemase
MKSENNYYAYAFISLNNLKNNLKIIKERIPPKTEILIPVKSNAYGFGAIEISKFLEKEKISFIGTAFPFEAFNLRKNNIKSKILIFNEPLYENDFFEILNQNITPTIFTEKTLLKFNSICQKFNKKLKIHIKIDTGMGRLGVPYKKAFEFIIKASNLSNIIIDGIYSHLSSADFDKKFTLKQIKIFDEILNKLFKNGIKPNYIHIGNSAAIINFPNLSYNLVRPGIIFYGYFPDNKIRKNIDIKPGMTLISFLTYIKKTEPKTPISYGHTYWTKKSEIIGTVSLGYGDGLNRLLSNNHFVFVNNKKCPIRGRICMDQFMIDLTNVTNAKIGNKVLIFGEYNNKIIRLENIAEKLKTIPYEILCNIGERVKRVYV